MIEFLYKQFDVFGKLVSRPWIECTILNPATGKGYPINGLLDSGADTTLIPKSLGEALGFDLKSLEKSWTYGIGGRLEVYIAEVDLRFRTDKGMITVKKVPLHISEAGDQFDISALFGRQGIFSNFDVLFKESQGKLILTPAEK